MATKVKKSWHGPKSKNQSTLKKKQPKPNTSINDEAQEIYPVTDDEVRAYYHIPVGARLIYTDGSVKRDTKNKTASGGIGVFFGQDDPRNIASPLPGNQNAGRAEVYAILKALESLYAELTIPRQKKIVYILTDCMKAIDLVARYNDCKRRMREKYGIPRAHQLLLMLGKENTIVQFQVVPGHKGILGNEMADQLAKIGATMPRLDKQIEDLYFDHVVFPEMVWHGGKDHTRSRPKGGGRMGDLPLEDKLLAGVDT